MTINFFDRWTKSPLIGMCNLPLKSYFQELSIENSWMKVHIKKLWTCKVIRLIISQFWDPWHMWIIGILSFYSNPYHHLHSTLLRRKWWFDLPEFGWRCLVSANCHGSSCTILVSICTNCLFFGLLQIDSSLNFSY